MGHVLSTGFKLISSPVRLNDDLHQGLKRMSALAAKGNITPREKQHVQAVQEWSDGYENTHTHTHTHTHTTHSQLTGTIRGLKS